MKKIISLLLIVMLSLGISVYAENPAVLDDSVYYGEASFYLSGSTTPLSTIQAGDIVCKYSVINADGEAKAFSVLCGLYKDDVLQSLEAKTVTASAYESKNVAFTKTVPSGSGYAIHAFLVRNLNIRTPLKSFASLSEKSNEALITEFTLNGFKGSIDNASNLITVTMPKDTVLSGATAAVTVSAGASYEVSGTDYTNPVTITVTAANGAQKVYTVQVEYEGNTVLFDFDSYKTGATPQSQDSANWAVSSDAGDCYAHVTEENGNQILSLVDLSSDGANAGVKAEVRSKDVLNCSVPFKMTMKVRYAHVEGKEREKDLHDFGYSPFYVRDNNVSLCGIQPAYNTDAYYMYYQNNGSSVQSTYKITPGVWYDIEMYYYKGNDGKYYTDYTFADPDGNSLKIAASPSGQTAETATRYYFSTSTKRQCVVSYDDIKIEEVKDDTVSYTNDFSDASALSGWSGVTVNDGTAQISSKASYTAYVNLSAEMGFDFYSENLVSGTQILKLNTADSSCALTYKDGALYYSYGAYESRIDTDKLTAAQPTTISVKCVNDRMYENVRLELVIDGEVVANLPFVTKSQTITTLEFAGVMNLDNFFVKSL